jgi:hypothetical protein
MKLNGFHPPKNVLGATKLISWDKGEFPSLWLFVNKRPTGPTGCIGFEGGGGSHGAPSNGFVKEEERRGVERISPPCFYNSFPSGGLLAVFCVSRLGKQIGQEGPRRALV